MQYILSQEEYDEYMLLKKERYITKTSDLTKVQKLVYWLYYRNPWMRYAEAAFIRKCTVPAIHAVVDNLIKKWYMWKDSEWNAGVM